MTDIILHGGTIVTMDEQHPTATALAVRQGQVSAVGGDEILAQRRGATQLIDLAGRTVCPGFVDAHHHISLAAWYERGIDLGNCRSVGQVLERLAGYPRSETDAGDQRWLYAYNYAPRHFNRGSSLTRWDLDRVVGDRPAIVMHFSFHEAIVSSAGLRMVGIDRHSRDPLGGRIARDRHGEPTGELLETALGRVEEMARSSSAGTGYENWIDAIERYSQDLFAAGITHVCDPGVDRMLEAYLRRAHAEGRLIIPVSMLFVSAHGLYRPPRDRLSGPVTGDILDGLCVGALKLFADGGSRCAVCVGLRESLLGVVALVGRAARLRKPGLLLAARAPERPRLCGKGGVRLGYLHYDRRDLAEICKQAHAAQFQLAVHAACNAGIDAALYAYESLPTGPYRHRLEHLVSLDRKQAQRIAATGAIGVVQPAYITHIGDEWEAMPTPPRLHSVPLRDLIDAGVTLAGSSDAPVVPFQPLAGMQAAVSRRTAKGLIHQGDQSISAVEALSMWTRGAALAANLSGQIGVLRPGARADLVVLSGNPLRTSPDSLGRICVEQTMIGGKTVFSRPSNGRSLPASGEGAVFEGTSRR
ncbi:MAG: amidohydrolase [Chloroflexota bacterium]